jgi:hypothetical protein
VKRPGDIAAALLAGLVFVIAAMLVVDVMTSNDVEPEPEPEPGRSTVERADFDEFVGRFRCVTFTGPRCRHLAPTTTTTTTAPPPTTITPPAPAPSTTVPPEAPPVAPAAPEAAPAPADAPPPATDLWAVYSGCSRGLASNLEVIPGDTSWATTSGTIRVGQWHVDQGGSILCWTLAHEDGHLWAFRYGSQAYLGAPPEGFASGDVETWADCYALVLTGYDRGGCGAELAASARAVM